MLRGSPIAIAALTAIVTACGGPQVDNANLARAIQTASPAEVTVRCRVATLLSDSNGPDGTHERFDVDCNVGPTIEIDHNLSLAPRVPIRLGATVTIHGQFEPDPGHPVIHYTHHATGAHPGGWIQLDERTYQ